MLIRFAIGTSMAIAPLLAHAFCFDEAAAKYAVDAKMLQAIATVESKMTSGIVGPANKNGTYDIGMMQINSSWLPKLKQAGISESQLKNDACTNVHVGAWILSESFKTYGKNWRAIGAYNAISEDLRTIYAQKVYKAYYSLQAQDTTIAIKKPQHNGASRAINILFASND